VLKYGVRGLVILILVICGVWGGFDLFLVVLFIMGAIYQFAHVWSRQGYVISFKDFIAPIINLLVGIIILLGIIINN